ncbi:MAG: hypothetical protein QXR45_06350 [Candidatus Bathyarchaeia archaeon]
MVKLGNAKYAKIILTLIFILTTITAFISIQNGFGTEYAIMRIINPFRGDGKFLFNVTEEINFTGQVFTVEFYIYNVSDMIAWQFAISWNNSIIRYNASINPTTWVFPEGHVFQQAEDEGYSVIKAIQLVEVETPTGPSQDPTAPGIATLKAGSTTIPFYPVNVGSQGALLCRINFTIVATPQPGETLTTNINLIKVIDPLNPSLDSFIMHSDMQKMEIITEPAVVKIIAGELIVIRDVAIQDVNIIGKMFVGSNITVKITFKNKGNDQERFNFTISCEKEDGSFKMTLFTYSGFLMNPDEEKDYLYVWNIPLNLTTGKYILTIYVEPLEGEVDITNNKHEVAINIEKELSYFEYVQWLILLWLSTPLGILFIIYLISIVGLFSTIAMIRRIRFR